VRDGFDFDRCDYWTSFLRPWEITGGEGASLSTATAQGEAKAKLPLAPADSCRCDFYFQRHREGVVEAAA
jgi:hypothetical protein